MPTRLAIAAAVSPWSPVITITLSPARWQLSTAAATSGLGGSSIATSPRRVRSASASSRLSGTAPVEVPFGDGEHPQPLGRVAVHDRLDPGAARRRSASGPLRSQRSRYSAEARPRARPSSRPRGRPPRSSIVDISRSDGSKWKRARRSTLALRDVDLCADAARPPRGSPPRSGLRRARRSHPTCRALLQATMTAASSRRRSRSAGRRPESRRSRGSGRRSESKPSSPSSGSRSGSRSCPCR